MITLLKIYEDPKDPKLALIKNREGKAGAVGGKVLMSCPLDIYKRVIKDEWITNNSREVGGFICYLGPEGFLSHRHVHQNYQTTALEGGFRIVEKRAEGSI
jgi:hypothetical protein